MDKFCMKCGTELIDGVCPKCVQGEAKPINRSEEKFRNVFMSPNERLVAVLGNSYLENFFQNGSYKNGFAVISDKRVYFQGKNYYVSHDEDGRTQIIKNQQSRTVDLKDITGTRTDSYANKTWLIWACVSLIFPFLLIILSTLSLFLLAGRI